MGNIRMTYEAGKSMQSYGVFGATKVASKALDTWTVPLNNLKPPLKIAGKTRCPSEYSRCLIIIC